MEDRIRRRYSSRILDQALSAYGILPAQIQELDGFESFIYEFQREEDDGILRVTHSLRRTPGQIRGELDWINYLKEGGAGVARALPDLNGDLLVEIDDGSGGLFLANTFERARGEIYRGDWDNKFLFEYGRQIGLMHSLTSAYQPPDPSWKRPEWDDPIHLEVIDYVPDSDEKITAIYLDLVEETRSLPKDSGSYGLIHQDAHRGNFFVDEEGRFTFFDFDDSSYSWFVEDIALVLFYAVMGQEDQAGFTRRFLDGFLPGYFVENHLDLHWFDKIPLFLKRRELDLYAVIHRSFDVENMDDPWCLWYMDGRKERVEAEIPYLEFDFSGLDLSEFSHK
jgi:Ser/Thr protein kinase RdoA (MazF antagonist)